MSDKDNQLEIELEPAETAEKEPEIEIVEKEEEVKAESQNEIPVIPPEQGIQELRRRLEEEHRLRKEAEHYAQYATQQATKAYEQVGETEFHLVANALETVKRDNDILKTHLRDAMAIGDHEKVAEIQEAMSFNAVKLNQLEMGKKEMETRPRQPAFNPPPPPPPLADPLDQIAAAVSPRSASWINANRDKLKDERAIRKMFRAHEDAVDEGYAPDSDAYFQFVEQRMGISRATDAQASSPMSSAAAPMQRKAAPPAAPVTRSGNGTGSKPNVVRLTREQAEFARMNGMTEQEYAKHLMDLRKEGKIAH